MLRRRVGVAIGVTVCLGVAIAVWQLRDSTGNAAPPAVAATATTRVARTNLSTSQQVSGALGFSGSYQVANAIGTTASQRAQAQMQMAQADAQSAAFRQQANGAAATSAAQAAADQDAVTTAQAVVDGDQRQLHADRIEAATDQAASSRECAAAGTPSPACTADRQAVTTDTQRVQTDQQAQIKDQGAVSSAQAKMNLDRVQGQQQVMTYEGQADAAQAQADAIRASGQASVPTTITWVPQVGDVLARGARLFDLDGRAVTLFLGPTPFTRDLHLGVADGPDVTELNQNLIALGFDPQHRIAVRPRFSQASDAAIRRWEASRNMSQDGILHYGYAIAEPNALRVTAVAAQAGGAATPGAQILAATSTTPAVTLALPVAQEYLVHDGDRVLIDLPDGHTTTSGHVAQVSAVASTATGSPQGQSPPPASQQQGQQQLSGNTTVNVTVKLDHPSAVQVLDQAPVQVDITDQSVFGVLAVPVNALLAQPGGGYAVAVHDSTGRRLVPVQTGLFANGLVQVRGSGISAGSTVEVPAS
jgi:hypothetical protein